MKSTFFVTTFVLHKQINKHMQEQTQQDKQLEPKPRSEELSKDELRRLEKEVSKFPTKQKAGKAIGIPNRNTLRSILKGGSGSFENIEIIRKYLSSKAA